MGASFSDRFYIAAPQGVAAKLSSMLLAAQIMPSGVVHTGVEAVRAAQGGAMLLTTYRLPDMTGEELARGRGNGERRHTAQPDQRGRAGAERQNARPLPHTHAAAPREGRKALAHAGGAQAD